MFCFYRSNRFALVSAVLTVAALTATAFAGPIWDCQDPQEPGGTPQTAQSVTGTGPLSAITCTLTGTPVGATDAPQGDFEDMFLIQITDPASFQANTVDPETGNAFNTQIWLFDANGRGVLANAEDSGKPPFSFMGNAANDGSGSVVDTPGLYYIAISGGELNNRGRFPVDAGGNEIFDFDAEAPEVVYGPLTTNPVAGWKGEGEIGDYVIELVGAEFVPPPPVPTITEWGLILLALLLLTAGTIIIRQMQHRSAPATAG